MRRRRCRRATPFTGALRGRGPIYRFGFFAGPAWKAAEKGKRKNAGEPAWLPRASAVCHFRLCGVRRLAQRFNRRVRGGHAGTKEKNKNRRRVELRRFFSVLSGKGGLHPAGRDPRGESLRSGGGPEADACRAAAFLFAALQPHRPWPRPDREASAPPCGLGGMRDQRRGPGCAGARPGRFFLPCRALPRSAASGFGRALPRPATFSRVPLWPCPAASGRVWLYPALAAFYPVRRRPPACCRIRLRPCPAALYCIRT